MARRTWEQMAGDRVLALGNYGWGGPFDMTPQDERIQAVERVCGMLPEPEYQRFKTGMRNRVWFTPSLGLGDTTKDLPVDRLIYISPMGGGPGRVG